MNPGAYLRQVREELSRVTWPTRTATINMTMIVLGVSTAVGLYIGGLDSLFAFLLDQWIQR